MGWYERWGRTKITSKFVVLKKATQTAAQEYTNNKDKDLVKINIFNQVKMINAQLSAIEKDITSLSRNLMTFENNLSKYEL